MNAKDENYGRGGDGFNLYRRKAKEGRSFFKSCPWIGLNHMILEVTRVAQGKL